MAFRACSGHPDRFLLLVPTMFTTHFAHMFYGVKECPRKLRFPMFWGLFLLLFHDCGGSDRGRVTRRSGVRKVQDRVSPVSAVLSRGLRTSANGLPFAANFVSRAEDCFSCLTNFMVNRAWLRNHYKLRFCNLIGYTPPSD